MKNFIQSLLQRKVMFALYSIAEKWVLLLFFIPINTNTLILIFGKDIVLLSLLGIITYEKVVFKIDK